MKELKTSTKKEIEEFIEKYPGDMYECCSLNNVLVWSEIDPENIQSTLQAGKVVGFSTDGKYICLVEGDVETTIWSHAVLIEDASDSMLSMVALGKIARYRDINVSIQCCNKDNCYSTEEFSVNPLLPKPIFDPLATMDIMTTFGIDVHWITENHYMEPEEFELIDEDEHVSASYSLNKVTFCRGMAEFFVEKNIAILY